MTLCERLFAAQDASYKSFQCRLMPGVPPDRVIGVRMPVLRRIAREIEGTHAAERLLNELPHRYYEEDNLHGILLSRMRGYREAVAALERFLPWVDNWATCDLIRPRAFRAHPEALPGQLRLWLQSTHPYTVRFAMEMLMVYYLDEAFVPAHPEWVADAVTGEYYVRMMAAWYFATALSVRYEEILPFLAARRLDLWTHNMTIRKACESYRISAEEKAQLRTMRRKE